MFPQVLSEDFGLCKKFEACFQVSENTVLVFKSNRKVPFTAIAIVNEELNRQEKRGIIKKVEYSMWATPMVCIKKKTNKISLCVDFSTGFEHHPLPTPEDIFTKLNGGKIFTKLGLSDAYSKIKVNDKCSKYLTINTHRGLYRYTQLPFGLKVAPVIFQQIMDTMLSDCEFTISYLDDILIKSNSCEQYVEHIKQLCSRKLKPRW
ncbi:uncharacterized protein K02A2.6-like [Octopus bimaculoides]|uniref:uncharacterized protein K02A2.6-like n=1 Tax=Octopus bimaculoides TaxID=37653 RepID=UPI00071DEB23|nr:uncharacterized protein K02A2.6-like [Octopus bimaculoides]|eukprot:XP_014774367.1 PREDICTED: uncharacterized protein K02A2.6-like [Octopus bimaculoides]